MTRWGRRIRAAISIGLIWGAGWFAAGILLARVPGFFSDLPFALIFAPLGFTVGVLFSGILVVRGGRRGFDRLSLPRAAGWGAVSGLLLAGIFVSGAFVRGDSVWREFLVFGPTLAIASALSAAGSLNLARRDRRPGLLDPSADPVETGLPEHGTPAGLGRGDGGVGAHRRATSQSMRDPDAHADSDA